MLLWWPRVTKGVAILDSQFASAQCKCGWTVPGSGSVSIIP